MRQDRAGFGIHGRIGHDQAHRAQGTPHQGRIRRPQKALSHHIGNIGHDRRTVGAHGGMQDIGKRPWKQQMQHICFARQPGVSGKRSGTAKVAGSRRQPRTATHHPRLRGCQHGRHRLWRQGENRILDTLLSRAEGDLTYRFLQAAGRIREIRAVHMQNCWVQTDCSSYLSMDARALFQPGACCLGRRGRTKKK